MSEISAGAPPPDPLGSWRALVRSFGTLVAGEGAARLLGLVAVIALARRLEPGGFGLVTIGLTLVVWFSLVVDFGTETLNVRDISRRPDRLREIAQPVLGLRLLLSAAAVGVLGLGAFIVADGSDRWVLALFALVLPAHALNLRWMVLGVRASKAVAMGNVASQLLFMVGVLLVVNSSHDILDVPILQVVAELAYAAVVLGAVARRFGLLRPVVDLAAWRSTLRASLPLFVNNLARATMYSVGLLLVGVFMTRGQVGFYGAAHRPVLFFAGALGLFYVSFLASYSAAGREDAQELCRRTLRLAAVLTIPAAAVLSAGAGTFVSLVYGDAYAPATVTLAILVWMLPLLALMGPYHMALIAGDRQRALMRINVAGAVVSVVGNVAAVPLAGIEGVAAVAVVSQLLVLVLSYRQATALDLAPPLTVSWVRRAHPIVRAEGD